MCKTSLQEVARNCVITEPRDRLKALGDFVLNVTSYHKNIALIWWKGCLKEYLNRVLQMNKHVISTQ